MSEEPDETAEPTEDEQQRQAEAIERLDSLGMSLAQCRAEAIAGREQTGIEDMWREDDEHYNGIDDANRDEMKSSWRTKPAGQAGIREERATSSTVFPNITAPYVDAAAARVGDMLLPTDDKGWTLDHTTLPELVDVAKGEVPQDISAQISAAYPHQDMAAAETERLVERTKKIVQAAKDKAQKASSRIEDWHSECQYTDHVRLVIDDSARLGTGVLKGPIPAIKPKLAYINGELVTEEKIKPISRRISVQNCFPDPGCGDNIHNGAYHWEKDDITKRELRAMIGTPGAIESQIKACLDEGAMSATKAFDQTQGITGGLVPRDTKNLFEIWYYYGEITKDDLEAACCEPPKDGKPIYAQLTMVNNRVIKAALNPIDTGDFPYDYMVWKRREGSPFGIGVGRQIRTPQRIITAILRNIMDNAGIAGGPMLLYRKGMIRPADGKAEIRPRKIWEATEDMDKQAFEAALRFIEIPMVQAELQAIFELGLKLAEDVTGLPMLLQGQQGSAPDTVGGMQIINNNGSTVLRRIARLFDGMLTEPHVRRYYSWLLLYGEDDEKGDFSVNARGSSALVERELQNQFIMQLGQMILNPVFGKDPKKWMNELLKSQHLDPTSFDYEDDEWKQIVEQMSQQPQDQRLAIAQLGAQLQERLKTMELQVQQQENEKDRMLESAMREVDIYIEQQRQAGNKDVSLDQIRAKLADTVMRLKTQVTLSAHKVAGEALKAPSEPSGKAKPGMAFTQ